MALLETRGLTKRFGGLAAVDDLTFTAEAGKITALIGPNGSGKTTSINLISGVLRATSGDVRLAGESIVGLDAHRITRLGISRTYQKNRLFPKMTAFENVLVGCHLSFRAGLLDIVGRRGRLRREEEAACEKAMELLAMVGLADKADELPNNLPYGFRRSLEIARALASDPKMILLDEPAAGMNRDEFVAVQELIGQVKARGVAILLVEHTMELVEAVADKVVVLNFGRKLTEGTFAEIAENPEVIEAYLGKEEL